MLAHACNKLRIKIAVAADLADTSHAPGSAGVGVSAEGRCTAFSGLEGAKPSLSCALGS